jgi:hypothetical protein
MLLCSEQSRCQMVGSKHRLEGISVQSYIALRSKIITNPENRMD